MTTAHKGSCLCGEVVFEIEGEFEHFFLCHCDRCRKDTGSAHAANLFSNDFNLRWLSGENQVRSYQLPGSRHAKSFCLNCGSALPHRLSTGSVLMVPAGSLDSELSIKPQAHLFCSERASWDDGLERVPSCEELPEKNASG
ncbi:GFA family protein [Coraliomargarita algicola]|uniref:GFA family protein n=1 Tax=Coraliomargarita algicola TaxID=3092156 RepID=A0ABZ0RM46_9BACT|nr:GFA family protein [Coraliomargarita sp. J2-16]WPJ96309.1 GFA family protein [Coraliomargarita sp. J2-16]